MRSSPTGACSPAFRDYLAHYNHGRGIVFIGHSQGATILIRLIQQEVDTVPSVRRRLVSALLMGGNVTVPQGKTVGGDFKHIPACSSATEIGCVVAYSSFTSKPLADSQFGRSSSDAGVGLLARRHLSPSLEIMCVNPASPSGGTGWLQPYIPALALTFIGRACRYDTVGDVPRRVHRPLRELGQRDLAPSQPPRRQRGPPPRAHSATGADPRVAHTRREHRARKPRKPRRPPSRRLRSPLTTQISGQPVRATVIIFV